MSMHIKNFIYLREMMNLIGLESFKGLKFCELGDTRNRGNFRDYLQTIGLPRYTKFFEYLEHEEATSIQIDVNGQDGALLIDLGNLIDDKKMLGQFDIVLDCGTSEHIDNQYIVFKNIFNLLKVGGIVIHYLPLNLSYKGHSGWKYTLESFNKFAIDCKYELIDGRITCNHYYLFGISRLLVFTTLRKTEDTKFIKKEKFNLSYLDERGFKKDKESYGEDVKKVRGKNG